MTEIHDRRKNAPTSKLFLEPYHWRLYRCGVPYAYVSKIRPALMLELGGGKIGGPTDFHIEKVLVERWESLDREERVTWWFESGELLYTEEQNGYSFSMIPIRDISKFNDSIGHPTNRLLNVASLWTGGMAFMLGLYALRQAIT